jgi:hypothetical protein
MTLYDLGFLVRVLENTMSDQTAAQHSVVVAFRFSGDDLQLLYALEEALATAVTAAGAGSYDGHEIALIDSDDAFLFLIGPDANELYAAAQPVLAECDFLRGAEVTLREGLPDDEAAPQRSVRLDA